MPWLWKIFDRLFVVTGAIRICRPHLPQSPSCSTTTSAEFLRFRLFDREADLFRHAPCLMKTSLGTWEGMGAHGIAQKSLVEFSFLPWMTVLPTGHGCGVGTVDNMIQETCMLCEASSRASRGKYYCWWFRPLFSPQAKLLWTQSRSLFQIHERVPSSPAYQKEPVQDAEGPPIKDY